MEIIEQIICIRKDEANEYIYLKEYYHLICFTVSIIFLYNLKSAQVATCMTNNIIKKFPELINL